MEGGMVYGVGMKGKVMDFEDLVVPKDLRTIHFYVGDDMAKKRISSSTWNDFLRMDHHDYVVKEFMEPYLHMKAVGFTKKTYFMRELEGFKHTLNDMIGISFQGTMVYGVELIGEETCCFVIHRKCKKIDPFTMTFLEWRRFVTDILSQLVQLQKRNIAHGDIKLDNIMKCKTYQLIDWENSRVLDYESLQSKRYLGLSPMYFQILYGNAWYPAFSIALLKYNQETGSSDYGTRVTAYFSELFQKYSPKEVFEKTKYTLDVGTFGFILDGTKKNPSVPKRYHAFINRMYKMTASEALAIFKKKTRRV
jgi:serine/threonine protein kinase